MVKATVIIPTYNSQNTIKRTIESVVNQSYSNLEILIVDNGSNDDTVEIVKSYISKDSRIRLLISEHGRSKARNFGLQHATGKYIQFLDSDDEIKPDKVARAVLFLEKNKDYGAYISSSVTINDKTNKVIRTAKVGYAYKNGLLGYNPYRINCVIFLNTNNIIEFNETIDFCEDWLFWVDNLADANVYLDTKNYDAVIHVTGHNTSNDYKKMNLYQIYARCLIKQRKPKRRLRLFIRDIRLASIYLLLELDGSQVDSVIQKKLFWQLLIIKIALKIPKIHDAFWKREQRDINENEHLEY